jgi:glycerol uptake facilitator-like aquaporin
MVILKVTKSDRFSGHAPWAISLALVGIHLAAVPLSGASVNPARSLGSAFVGGDMSHIWIYLVAPLVGAVVGWALYQLTTSGTVNVAVETD